MLRSGDESLWTVVVETVFGCGKLATGLRLGFAILACILQSITGTSSPRSGAAHRAGGRACEHCRSNDPRCYFPAQGEGNSARSAETASNNRSRSRRSTSRDCDDCPCRHQTTWKTSNVQWITCRLEFMAVHIHSLRRRSEARQKRDSWREQSGQTQVVES